MGVRHVSVTVSVAVLLWSGIAGFLTQQHRMDMAAAGREARAMARALEQNVRRAVEDTDTTLRALRAARAHDPEDFKIASWQVASGLTDASGLEIADRAGTVTQTSDAVATGGRVDVSGRDDFLQAKARRDDVLYVSRPALSPISDRWSLHLARPSLDALGGFDGIIGATLDPARLSRISDVSSLGGSALLVLGDDGRVRAAAPASIATPDSMFEALASPQGASAELLSDVRIAATGDGISRIYGVRRVDPYGLTVLYGVPTADTDAVFRRTALGGIAIGLVLTIMLGLAGAAVGRDRDSLARSREILQAAVDNISQGLMVIDAQRRVSLLNARAADLLELPPGLAVAGIRFDALLEWQTSSGEFDASGSERVRALVHSGGLALGNSVYQRTRHNGVVLEIRTSVLDSGLAIRTFTDITEQQHTARVLAEARDAAEAAARARSDFLAVMSHEIRTPLNGVIGVAGLLEDMELGDVQREFVRMIRESGDNLLLLINGILDFSRLEASGVQLEEVAFDPRELVRGVVGLLLIPASNKGLRLSVTVADQVPVALLGDPGRLRQVLLNLVGNAIKFTDRGWVRLGLTAEACEQGRLRMLFEVADSGIGIVPDAIERMFEEFTQLDGSISRRFGGSGLGLAISRRLVNLMGGKITVESHPGAGSTFRFDVTLCETGRIPAAPAVLPHHVEQPTGPSLRILLAEDNAANRVVSLRLLERLGHATDSAKTGFEVLAAMDRADYDLVLMDVMMPDMDGLTATRRIRARERFDCHIAIVGLTAGSRPETLADCLQAGMDAVTTKPVTVARLRAAIEEGLGAAARARGPMPDAGGDKPRPVAPSLDDDVHPEDSGMAAGGAGDTTARMRQLSDDLGPAAVAEIIDTFVEDSQALLLSMRDDAASGDGRLLRLTAHSLAGAARNVGADALALRAELLEQNVGSLNTAQMTAEVAAMRAERLAVLPQLALHRDAVG